MCYAAVRVVNIKINADILKWLSHFTAYGHVVVG